MAANGKQFSKVEFQIAVNETQEKVHFIRCVAFGTQADNMIKFLHKGSQLAVEGKITSQKFIVNNETRTVTKVVAQNITFLDAKPNN
ncbi:single-stranded DNA-binding protein [Candidatus Phytoplasma solani]|nr:single-stranded DNA-binding protein [Candidatus Phytoplasma solani]